LLKYDVGRIFVVFSLNFVILTILTTSRCKVTNAAPFAFYSSGLNDQKKLAAAFIVGLMPAELSPKKACCCFHRRAEAGRIETKRGWPLLLSSSG
jgi:hypothetical protein